jgi:hypothetical protein
MLAWNSFLDYSARSGTLGMSTTPQYDTLRKQITDELQLQVLDLLEDNPQGMSRSKIILTIFGVFVPPAELASSVYDRKIRKAIEGLRKDWPIVSNSGEAGYRLSEDAAEIDAYAAEQAARAAKETEKARQAHSWPAKIKSIQEYRKSGVKASQERLI